MNCREDNVCALCKYWLGSRPKVNYRTGDIKAIRGEGLCAKDATNGEHQANSLCFQFEKRLEYL